MAIPVKQTSSVAELYERAGFRLVKSEPHRSFRKRLVSQHSEFRYIVSWHPASPGTGTQAVADSDISI